MFWGSLLAFGFLLLIYARMTTFIGGVVVLFFVGFPQAAVNVSAGPLLLRAVPRELIGRVVSLVGPTTALAGILSTAGAAYLATSVLAGFHQEIGAVRFGTYDAIFTFAGLLMLAGGAYAMLSLRRSDAVTPKVPTG